MRDQTIITLGPVEIFMGLDFGIDWPRFIHDCPEIETFYLGQHGRAYILVIFASTSSKQQRDRVRKGFWKKLYERGVVESPEVPEVIEGSPALMKLNGNSELRQARFGDVLFENHTIGHFPQKSTFT